MYCKPSIIGYGLETQVNEALYTYASTLARSDIQRPRPSQYQHYEMLPIEPSSNMQVRTYVKSLEGAHHSILLLLLGIW